MLNDPKTENNWILMDGIKIKEFSDHWRKSKTRENLKKNLFLKIWPYQ